MIGKNGIKEDAPNNTLHPTRFPLQFDPSAKLRGSNFRGKRAAERGVKRGRIYLIGNLIDEKI